MANGSLCFFVFFAAAFVICATALDMGDTLLSGNAKHFREVPLLDTSRGGKEMR